jgi:beta-glucosidase
MVGYRQYDTEQTDILFPFGYGLSYTQFSYGILAVDVKEEDELRVEVTARVANTGAVAGSAVVQLYVKALGSAVERPLHELKGFEKVFLEPGESRMVHFTLGCGAFDYYDEQTGRFVTEPGRYAIEVAEHARDIRAVSEFTIQNSHYRAIDTLS